MPRKRRTTEGVEETVTGSGKAVVRISAKALNQLIDEANMCMQRSSEAGGQIGSAIKEAAKKKGLDPIAFRFILRLRRMGERDPAKLASVLFNFDDYRLKSKLDQIKAQDLFREFQPGSEGKSKDEEFENAERGNSGDTVVHGQFGGQGGEPLPAA